MGWNSYYDAPLLQSLLASSGIPPIDSPTFVAGTQGQLVASGNVVQLGASYLDVSRYQSLVFSWTDFASLAYTGTDARSITFTWYSSNGGTIIDSVTYQCQVYRIGVVLVPGLQGVLRCRGPWLGISGGSVARDSSITAVTYGSYRNVQNDKLWIQPQAVYANALPTTRIVPGLRQIAFNAGGFGAAGTYSISPAFQPGDYNVYANTTPAATLILARQNDQQEFYKLGPTTAGTPTYGTVSLPGVPVTLSLTLTAATTFNLVLTRTGDE